MIGVHLRDCCIALRFKKDRPPAKINISRNECLHISLFLLHDTVSWNSVLVPTTNTGITKIIVSSIS